MAAIANVHTQAVQPKPKATKAKACIVSFGEFARNAQPIEAVVGDVALQVMPNECSTGTFGWRADFRLEGITLANGVVLPACTAQLVVYVPNSKLAVRVPGDGSMLSPPAGDAPQSETVE